MSANKFAGSGIKSEIMPNQQLSEELHIRKFEKQKVYSSFKNNIWCAYLTDIQLIRKFNKGFRFLLCVIDIYSKYPWVASLKDKKVITISNAFQKKLGDSNCKPNKIWIDKSSEY